MTPRTPRPPIERLRQPAAVTVDRGGRSRRGPLRALGILAALAVAGWIAVTAWRAGEPHLRAALREGQAVLAELGLTAPPAPPAPAPGSRRAPTDLERLHAAIARNDADRTLPLIARVTREALDEPVAGMTSLMRAASAGDAQVVRALLAAGADPDARGSHQRTALQYAAEKNRLEAARLLLDAGADIDGVDTGSLTPLVMAADRGYTEFALMLIERGANVNIQNVEGWTALMDAAEAGDVAVVKALLAAGALTGARHRNGWTALDFARHGQHAEVVRLLSRAQPAARPGAGAAQKKGARQ